MAKTEQQKPRIGMLLVQAGIVTAEQLEEALRIQEQTEERLGTVLVKLGYMAEEALTDAVGAQLQVPFIHLEKERFDPEIVSVIRRRTARARRCIPIHREHGQIVLAMADPLDLGALNEIERRCKERVEVRIAPESAVLAAIDRVYGP